MHASEQLNSVSDDNNKSGNNTDKFQNSENGITLKNYHDFKKFKKMNQYYQNIENGPSNLKSKQSSGNHLVASTTRSGSSRKVNIGIMGNTGIGKFGQMYNASGNSCSPEPPSKK